MQKVIKHKLLVVISFYVNLGTWIAGLLLLHSFRAQQFEQFFTYSMLVFATGIAYKLLRGGAKYPPAEISEIEWPITLAILHLVPFLNLLIYAIYFACGGSADVSWDLMFIAPLISGTGLVNYMFIYSKR
ncbi:hypothetical protein LRK24_05325 [Rhodanobacter denitrificans]|uniref:hypothetical protein n=1 Tax=Rhodanobacter denitrificans TaxID=666685 RepID=UPI000A9C5643|nr:hypothetical protein [Rhodanobacter denitrificans]UJM85635.1 hypothetical protein LRJ86_12700 [Rhodanobacter denitrificans]UJM91337.1 hypothetical protein LRK24_05325 [Rhodanobacter denitrificans]